MTNAAEAALAAFPFLLSCQATTLAVSCMVNEQSVAGRDHVSLLPRGWILAPLKFWRDDKPAALYFFVANFVFGTLGVWLPLLIAAMWGKSTEIAIQAVLDSGGLYFFAIPFLASIGAILGEAFPAGKQGFIQNLKALLICALVLSIVACAVLTSIQIAPGDKPASLNHKVQAVVSVISVVVGIYVFSLLRNERGSPAEDLQQGAKSLTEKSAGATVSREDFDQDD